MAWKEQQQYKEEENIYEEDFSEYSDDGEFDSNSESEDTAASSHSLPNSSVNDRASVIGRYEPPVQNGFKAGAGVPIRSGLKPVLPIKPSSFQNRPFSGPLEQAPTPPPLAPKPLPVKPKSTVVKSISQLFPSHAASTLRVRSQSDKGPLCALPFSAPANQISRSSTLGNQNRARRSFEPGGTLPASFAPEPPSIHTLPRLRSSESAVTLRKKVTPPGRAQLPPVQESTEADPGQLSRAVMAELLQRKKSPAGVFSASESPALGKKPRDSMSWKPVAQVLPQPSPAKPAPALPKRGTGLPGLHVPDSQPVLEKQPWFHGDIDREEAERRLQTFAGRMDGSFLVRSRSEPPLDRPYALSLFHAQKIYHLHIRRKGKDRYSIGREEKTEEPTFLTVDALVTYHRTNPLFVISRCGTNMSCETVLTLSPEKCG